MARKSATNSFDGSRAQRNRDDTRKLIADRAARLILEGGLIDWSLAKRKAARQLGLDEARALPDHEQIAAALQAYQALYQAEKHSAQLRAKRLEALEWMRRLERYSPILVGPVAEGWATEFSEACLNLAADSGKEVEFALLDAGVAYRALGNNPDAELCEFGIAGRHGPLRLVVATGRKRLAGSRTAGAIRLNAEELAAILVPAQAPPLSP